MPIAAPSETRPGDVPVYISDCERLYRPHATGGRGAGRATGPGGHLTTGSTRTSGAVDARGARRRDAWPQSIVTGSGGLIGSESVAHFVEAGYDVIGIENDMRAALLRARGLDDAGRPSGWSRRTPTFRSLDARHPRRRRRGRALRRARARPRAGRPHRRAALARLGRLGSADRLRRQRERHAQPARGDAARTPGRDLHLHARPTRSTATRRTACRSSELETRLELPADHRYFGGIDTTMSIDDVDALALRRLEGGRRPAGPGVRALLRASRPSASAAAASPAPTTPAPSCTASSSYLMRCTVAGEPYTVFGYGGKQVRDNIHSADLVRAFEAFHRAPRAGRRLQHRRRAREQLLDARGDRRSARRSPAASSTGRSRDQARMGDHRWWISDLRRVPGRLPRLGRSSTTSRRCCARSTSANASTGRRPRVKLSVVIPAHNEEGSIGATLARARGGARAARRSTTRSSSSTTRAPTARREVVERPRRGEPARPLPALALSARLRLHRPGRASTTSRATPSRS